MGWVLLSKFGSFHGKVTLIIQSPEIHRVLKFYIHNAQIYLRTLLKEKNSSQSYDNDCEIDYAKICDLTQVLYS